MPAAEIIVPTVFFLSTGFIIFSFLYFRSNERQWMIEKGLSAEQITELFKAKRNPVTWLRIGVVLFIFGICLGIGLMLDRATDNEFWIPLLVISGIGSGFIAAFFIGNKYDKTGS